MPKKLPGLCWHKSAKQFYVRIAKKDYYLGKDEAKAEAERLRLLAEWQHTGRRPDDGREAGTGLTVSDLVARYIKEHVTVHYRKPDGTPTSEQQLIRQACRPLRRLYAHTPAARFDGQSLETVRAEMMQKGCGKDPEKGKPLSRKVTNQHVGRIVRMFKWGVKKKLVTAAQHHELTLVDPLQAGRCLAVEYDDVPPAPIESVRAVQKAVSPVLRDMIELQLLTSMRPGEVCSLRPGDIDRTGDALRRALGITVELGRVWAYIPGSHKTQHKNKKRVIPIGPRAQALLAPYLERDPDAPCFSPAESKAWYLAQKKAKRKTPMTPSQRARKPKGTRPPATRWRVEGYHHAVEQACKKLGVEHWWPHMLRHNAATEIERTYGLDVARIICGHSSLKVTLTYVKADVEKAFRAMEQAG